MRPAMRIAFLTQGMHYGGVERWALTLAAGLTQIETAAFIDAGTARHPDIVREARRIAPLIEFQQVREGGKVTINLADAQEQMEQLRGVDAILASGTGRLDVLTHWLPCAKVLVSHVTPEWEGQGGLLSKDEPVATHRVAVSQAAAGCFSRPAAIIASGVDLARIAPTVGRLEQRRAWGLPPDAKVALYVGRFHPIKRADRLLDALHHLPPNWYAVFVGCSGSDSEQKRMVQIAASEHPGRCVFVAEMPQIGNALAAADCLVITSVSESFSLVWFEAMLAKLPVVTTDYQFVRELEARHGKLLAEVVLQDARSQEMAQAIEDSQANYNRVLDAQEIAWEQYTAPAMVARWEKYLLDTISRWQRKGWRGRQHRPAGRQVPVETWLPAAPAERPRVCYLGAYPQSIGGVETWLKTLVDHTRDRIDWSAAFYATAGVSQLDQDTVLSLRIPFALDDVRTAARDADLVLCWGLPFAKRLLAGFPGQTAIISHGGKGQWNERWVQALEEWADHRIAVSRQADVFRRPAVLLHNGIDTQRLIPRGERESIRQRMRLAPQERAVGFVGRISAEKNPLLVAQAVKSLGAPYRAVYVGRESEKFLEEVRKLVPSPIVVWPTQEMGDIYQALDCVVVASPAEGFSLVTVEAMLCGCRVISTPVGVLPELEEQHGQLAVPLAIGASPQQAAAAIRAAFEPERAGVVERARLAAGEFRAEKMADRWVDFLYEALQCPKPAVEPSLSTSSTAPTCLS